METSLWVLIWRGLRCRCPRCGQGRLYQGFYRLREQCERCELRFLKDPVDLLAFMYLSTAVITGFFILGMFWIVPTTSHWIGRLVVAGLAIVCIVLTLPFRKGVAIALHYWAEQHLDAD